MSAPSWVGEGRRRSHAARSWRLPTRVGLLFMACTSLAHAQASDAQLAVARVLAHEIDVLIDASKWLEATHKLNQVLRIKETPGLRSQLGYCYRNRGLLLEAAAEYARARAMIDAGVEAPDVVAFLNDERALLLELTPTLVLQVRHPGLPWKLTIDNKAHGPVAPEERLPLNPGTHRLVVTAPGYAPWELTLHLEQKDRRRFVATLEPLPPAPAVTARAEPSALGSPARDAKDAPTDTTWRPVVLVAAGGGGAVIGAVAFGIGFAVAQGNASGRSERSINELQQELGPVPMDTEEARKTWAKSCNGSSSADPDVAQSCGDLARGRTDEVLYGNGAIASFVTAGALAVLTAGAIWWTWPGATERQYSIAPAPSGDGALVSSRWRF